MARFSVIAKRVLLSAAVAAAVLVSPRLSQAQMPMMMPGGMPMMMPITPGGGNGFAGVKVDTDGVLRKEVKIDAGGQLMRQRIAAAKAALDGKVAVKSPLRKVSLNRLEAAIKGRLDNNKPLTDDMKYLAGLTRVQFVFYYPDTKDIVIAGPAEGWVVDPTDRVCGIESGRPVVELQDLVVALRAFPPGAKQAGVIGCSIDPTKEGLAKMQTFLKGVGSRATPADTEFIVNGLRESLGLQKINVTGVPANTHLAQVMVEADYRMKLIGIGLEKPPVKMASYVQNASPAGVSKNALQRWFFVPDYECVRVSEDDLAMQLEGEGVKLIGADEMVNADGSRTAAGSADKASKLFVDGFTKKYPELAAKSPVYAQLRNIIDLSVVAAFIQAKDYYGKAEWKMPVLSDEKAIPTQTHNTPVQVESAVTSMWKGNHLMTPIGGGVRIEAKKALDSKNLLEDQDGKVKSAREKVKLEGLAKGQWWWD